MTHSCVLKVSLVTIVCTWARHHTVRKTTTSVTGIPSIFIVLEAQTGNVATNQNIAKRTCKIAEMAQTSSMTSHHLLTKPMNNSKTVLLPTLQFQWNFWQMKRLERVSHSPSSSTWDGALCLRHSKDRFNLTQSHRQNQMRQPSKAFTHAGVAPSARMHAAVFWANTTFTLASQNGSEGSSTLPEGSVNTSIPECSKWWCEQLDCLWPMQSHPLHSPFSS